jgi:hypothetical protein
MQARAPSTSSQRRMRAPLPARRIVAGGVGACQEGGLSGRGVTGGAATCAMVAADTNGDFVITGTYSGPIDLGNGPLPYTPFDPTTAPSSGLDCFLAKISR